MREVEKVFADEVNRESYIRSLTDDFSVVDAVNHEAFATAAFAGTAVAKRKLWEPIIYDVDTEMNIIVEKYKKYCPHLNLKISDDFNISDPLHGHLKIDLIPADKAEQYKSVLKDISKDICKAPFMKKDYFFGHVAKVSIGDSPKTAGSILLTFKR